MAWCRVALALVCAVVGSTATALAAETRAVVELFTSQGCSSCPPADQLLGQLAKEPGVVAMSLPIDYWDYLGWKDTLATPGHTARQRGYAAVRGDRAVYTPQVSSTARYTFRAATRRRSSAPSRRPSSRPER